MLGLTALFQAIRSKLLGTSPSSYADWIRRYDTLGNDDRQAIGRDMESFASTPRFSILVGVYNCPEAWLRQCLASVQGQMYPHWQCIVVDDASTEEHCPKVIEEFAEKDDRFTALRHERNKGISRTLNTALAEAAGEYILVLDHDDVLAEQALYCFAKLLQENPHAGLLYADEDKINAEGERFSPYFKPGWNPDLFRSQNYLNHPTVLRKDIVEGVGGFSVEHEGSQDYDLYLKVSEQLAEDGVIHIPHVLYHWRAHEKSVAGDAGDKSYALVAARKALADHARRLELPAMVEPAMVESTMVEPAGVPAYHHLRFHLPEKAPLTSVIIPTNGASPHLPTLLESLCAVDGLPLEIIVVTNNMRSQKMLAYLEEQQTLGRLRLLAWDEPFNFSAIYNMAVAHAKGDVLAMLNDDLGELSVDGLKESVAEALRPRIGAVGAKLLYPDGRIQHAGVALGLGGVAGHVFKGLPADSLEHFSWLHVKRNCSAVTAACLFMRKAVFEEIGGFDEKLAVAFNDIDLCLRIVQQGYRIVYNPQLMTTHYESVSRGDDLRPEHRERFHKEIDTMQERWAKELVSDPHFSPNLSLCSERPLPAHPPRTIKPWAK
jgi:GT2 family glycosyltransferase